MHNTEQIIYDSITIKQTINYIKALKRQIEKQILKKNIKKYYFRFQVIFFGIITCISIIMFYVYPPHRSEKAFSAFIETAVVS